MEEQKIGSRKKNPIIRIIKIFTFSLVLCLVMCLFLTWYLTNVEDTLIRLEEKGKMDNTIWLVKYSSVLPPIIVCTILLTLFYKSKRAYIPVSTQRDKAIILTVVLVFTYAVLLTVMFVKSPGWSIPAATDDEDAVKSLIERSVIWFSVQFVPLLIAISYHLVRASNEKKELIYESESGECEEETNE